jgi:uncharacterized membrane protein
MATFGGSWAFLGIFGATLLDWIVWNVERPASYFDPTLFILLTPRASRASRPTQVAVSS